ncbi:MAG: hypothetical protein LBI53_06520 [Candidatus Peribacteria bacterium]|jgi:hypothetical protein|nr:hypothetical protein [Candidatus Peribacteria bacterium]
MFNQAYLPLNPDKLEGHPQLLDFILHGTFHKGYPFTEKKVLVYEMMKNADAFKEKLFDYEVLVIPTED